jgi:MtN3 and saliva related transmembrane protein
LTTATIIGIAAATFSISAFVPQAYKIFQTRDTKGLSTPMWILQVVAFALWVTFGLSLNSWPLIVENAICLVLSCLILGMKLRSD